MVQHKGYFISLWVIKSVLLAPKYNTTGQSHHGPRTAKQQVLCDNGVIGLMIQ